MAKYSAQGSITIRRLRNGDSFFISLDMANGIPLFQGVDEKSGTVVPDWTVADKQPIIIPKVTTARSATVKLSYHQWKHNGVMLNFNGATDEAGYRLDSTGKFKLNNDTGALRIVGNIASKDNMANDTLTYMCVASLSGIEYNLEKSVDILIQPVGATSYVGTVVASTEQLTSSVGTATLATRLWSGPNEVNDYYVKWWRDNEEWTSQKGKKTATVTRDDVDGTQLFIAEFFKDSSSTTPLYRAGIRIIDTLDDYQVVPYIASPNKEVDTGQPVTVKARVVRFMTDGTNQDITVSGGKWRIDVMDRKTWAVIKTAATDSIQVTTTETDRNGDIGDVEVVCEVEWS